MRNHYYVVTKLESICIRFGALTYIIRKSWASESQSKKFYRIVRKTCESKSPSFENFANYALIQQKIGVIQ